VDDQRRLTIDRSFVKSQLEERRSTLKADKKPDRAQRDDDPDSEDELAEAVRGGHQLRCSKAGSHLHRSPAISLPPNSTSRSTASRCVVLFCAARRTASICVAQGKGKTKASAKGKGKAAAEDDESQDSFAERSESDAPATKGKGKGKAPAKSKGKAAEKNLVRCGRPA
jgi:hypothetical protein